MPGLNHLRGTLTCGKRLSMTLEKFNYQKNSTHQLISSFPLHQNLGQKSVEGKCLSDGIGK